jgi:cytochrome c oxidase subunit 4
MSELEMQAHDMHADHASPNYLAIFVALAVLTLIEVAVSLLPPAVRLPLLAALMTTKVVLVAMFYMHLRFDSRWYTYIFVAPLPFVALITVALLVR